MALSHLLFLFCVGDGLSQCVHGCVVIYLGQHFYITVPKQPRYHIWVDPLRDPQCGSGVPLRYNKDKRKNPVFSRVSAFVVAYSIPFPTLIASEKSVE